MNTRRAKYQTVVHLRLACIVGDIKQPEYRLSYETGLSEPKLRAINILIEHPVKTLRALADQKTAGMSFANSEAVLAKSERLADATQVVRKTYVIDDLQWLMRTGDGVLSCNVVSDVDIALLRRVYEAIAECITKPKQVARRSRSRFDGYELAVLENHLEKLDAKKVWANPSTALRNTVMFDLQFYGGLRRSEILALKWEDIFPGRRPHYPPQIKVAARRDDRTDPRKRPPDAKAGPGSVTVPEHVFNRLNKEWREARDEIEERAEELSCGNNMRHNFVIVTTAESRRDVFGSPPTISGYDNAARKLCASCDILRDHLSSHALRHLCTTRYVRRRRDLGHSNDEIRKGMREFFRWSLTSSMPDYYTATMACPHRVVRYQS